MSVSQFASIQFQPFSPQGESIKQTLRRSMGILRSSLADLGMSCPNDEVRKMFKPFCIAADPQDGKLYMYTSPNDIIGAKKRSGGSHDVELLRVAEVGDDLRPSTLAKYKPLLDAVHLKGYLPKAPISTKVLPSKPAVKEADGALCFFSGILKSTPVTLATLASTVVAGGIGVLSATKALLQPAKNSLSKKVIPSQVGVYTFESDIPEVLNIEHPGLSFGM